MAQVRKHIVGHGKRAPEKGLRKREMEPFALELYAVVGEALSRYGLGPAAQRKLFAEAQRSKRIPTSSSAHLERMRFLGDLLAVWREEPLFVDDKGRPKVLPIHGRGATFESLARRFFPQESVEAVIDLAREYADVGLPSTKRIALYGDILVRLSDDEAILAQAVLHVRQVMDTCLYNLTRPRGAPSLTERIVGSVLSEEEFAHFQRLVRPQLQDVSERSDRLLKAKLRRHAKATARAPAGIGIYAFYSGPRRKKGRR